MHEMSIASALVDQVCDHAAGVGAARVAEINLRMGVLVGIGRALHFCFPSAARNTLCEGARLNIDEVPLTVMCAYCDAVKTPAALYNFRCPDCGRPTPKVLTGREMQLVSIGLVPSSAGAASARPGTMPNPNAASPGAVK
jgi:hydrogenase nickel incorporation protein HypA/HybF